MSTNFLRNSYVSGWLGVSGVLLIVGLLWAIGAVAAGQVERAQARDGHPVQVVETAAARCASGQAVPCTPVNGADPKPVPVAYR